MLPVPPAAMDWRALHVMGHDRGAEFFLRCLTYGNYLWRQGNAARAILAVDRGLLSAVPTGDPVLADHPLPYRALGWMIRMVPDGIFIGNPRVHYQHLADRVRGAREEQRRWRSWACWHLVRLIQPELPGDPRHEVVEPFADDIRRGLLAHGIEDEDSWWHEACAEATVR